MRIRRGLLFWGLFLVSVGAVPLLVRAGTVDAASLAGAWRLWPVILIAIGLALVAGRSQVALVGTAVTAIVLGIAAGGALATGNAWFGMLGVCTNGDRADAAIDGEGTFETPAAVSISLDCGNLQLSTHPGLDWSLHATFGGLPPNVDGGPDRLAITSPGSGSDRHQLWDLRLPSDAIDSIDLKANAGSGTVELGNADVTTFSGRVAAFDLSLDAAEAKLDRINLEVDAGRARISLGRGSLTGDLSVDAGAIDLCVPDDVPIRIRIDGAAFAHNLDDHGFTDSGDDVWTRPSGNLNATIELTVDGSAAALTLDPDGGCR